MLDTYCLDKVYATIFPLAGNDLLSAHDGLNSTFMNFGSHTHDRYGLTATHLLAPTSYATQSILGRGNLLRQAISLTVITTVFGWLLYFITACLSYYFVFDRENEKHPKFLKNQVWLEIKCASTAIPIMSLLTVPWFLAEVQGYSKLYWDTSDHSASYMYWQFPFFILFTDMLVYAIHRGLHHPAIYKHLHKLHHKWIVPTPFASHAFHPVDGYCQSLPYHIFPFLFPLHKGAYVALFFFVNVWSVMIHDGEYLARDPVINGSACHTIHHIYFNYNYGQYTTLWDRIGRSYRLPDQELYDKSKKTSKDTWEKQNSLTEEIQLEVEGADERVYATGAECDSKPRKR